VKKFKLATIALALTASVLVLGGCGSSAPAATDKTSGADLKLSQGVGQTSVFRAKVDKTTKQESYSTNYVTASAIFDQNDKIVSVQFDILEIAQASKKEGATLFPGWPSAEIKKDDVVTAVANWKTKRERGDAAYGMNWTEQVDSYQELFKGKTVAEVEQWFAKNTSDLNGTPLVSDSEKPEDQAKFAKLTDEEKTALADVTSGASISLKDDHGDFIGALKEAFENKIEVTMPAK